MRGGWRKGGLFARAGWWNKVFSVTEIVLEKEAIIKSTYHRWTRRGM